MKICCTELFSDPDRQIIDPGLIIGAWGLQTALYLAMYLHQKFLSSDTGQVNGGIGLGSFLMLGNMILYFAVIVISVLSIGLGILQRGHPISSRFKPAIIVAICYSGQSLVYHAVAFLTM